MLIDDNEISYLRSDANRRITLDPYTQAGMPNKRLAQSKLVRMILKEKHWPNRTMTQIANSLQVFERIGGDDGTRTRGLCRDRVAGPRNLLELNGTDSPFLIL